MVSLLVVGVFGNRMGSLCTLCGDYLFYRTSHSSVRVVLCYFDLFIDLCVVKRYPCLLVSLTLLPLL